MTDFLQHLAERALGIAPTVQPRIHSFHAPTSWGSESGETMLPVSDSEAGVRLEKSHPPSDSPRPVRAGELERSATKDAQREKPFSPSARRSSTGDARKPGPVPSEVRTQEAVHREPVVTTRGQRRDIAPQASGVPSKASGFSSSATSIVSAARPVAPERTTHPDRRTTGQAPSLLRSPKEQPAEGDRPHTASSRSHSKRPAGLPAAAKEADSKLPVRARPPIRAEHAFQQGPRETSPRASVIPEFAKKERAPVPPIQEGRAKAHRVHATIQAQVSAPAAEALQDAPTAPGRPNARQDDDAPAIQITIGRIEVRAIPPAQPPRRPERRMAPKLSLDDYLKCCGGRRE